MSKFGILKSFYENEGMKSLIDGYKAMEGNDPAIMSRLMKNGIAASGGEVFKPQYLRGGVAMWQMNVAGLRFGVPVTQAEMDKSLSLKTEDARRDYFLELLKEKSPLQYNAIQKLEAQHVADNKLREAAKTPWDRKGESLNPRIQNPVLRGNILNATIDGTPVGITIKSQQALDAYNRGDVSLIQLSNAALKSYDTIMAKYEANQALALERNVDESISLGFHR